MVKKGYRFFKKLEIEKQNKIDTNTIDQLNNDLWFWTMYCFECM